MNQTAEYAFKVPQVTLVFWIIKIAATTLGETGGDTVTMTLNWGYLAGTLLFFWRSLHSSALRLLSSSILGHDHSLHDVWHYDGRFCGSVFGNWLYRRCVDLIILPLCDTRPLVLIARLNIGRHC
jgi:hypothetical protein